MHYVKKFPHKDRDTNVCLFTRMLQWFSKTLYLHTPFCHVCEVVPWMSGCMQMSDLTYLLIVLLDRGQSNSIVDLKMHLMSII